MRSAIYTRWEFSLAPLVLSATRKCRLHIVLFLVFKPLMSYAGSYPEFNFSNLEDSSLDGSLIIISTSIPQQQLIVRCNSELVGLSTLTGQCSRFTLAAVHEETVELNGDPELGEKVYIHKNDSKFKKKVIVTHVKY